MQKLWMRRPDLANLPALDNFPPGYTLRTYRESDLEALGDLMRLAFAAPHWTVDGLCKALLEAPDVIRTFIVDYAGQPVATASVRLMEAYPGSGYVHWVATHPAHQGKRLGYLATLATLYEFRRLGCRDAILETDDPRLPAIKTYLHLGFLPEMRDASHPERWYRVLQALLGHRGTTRPAVSR